MITLKELQDKASSLGLTYLGAYDARPFPEKEEAYKEWINKGYHGDMAYLANHTPLKYHPSALVPEARSILLFGLNYYQEPSLVPPGEGRIALYGWGRDYHKVLGKRLLKLIKLLSQDHPTGSFRRFVDSGPLDERFYGEKGGLGYIGRNHLLISRRWGSYFFLGEIITNLDSEEHQPETHHGSCPSGCFRCIQACPTGALKREGPMDASLCISYLTIEYSGFIPQELWPLMGDWIFGCDLCQSSCPHNLRAQETEEGDFKAWKAGPWLPLEELLTLDREKLLKYGGSPLLRAGVDQLIRNALIVAYNEDRQDLLPLIKPLKDHENPVLARTSDKVSQKLQNKLDI